jgi:fatty-acyl-CoA synthase
MTDAIAADAHWLAARVGEIFESTVGGVLRDAASADPDQTALIFGVPEPAPSRRWTYAELLGDAERAAGALLERFEPGERLAIWAPNSPEWIVLEFGAALAGVVLVTVNPAFGPAELAYVLAQSRSAGIFLAEEYRGRRMAQALESVSGELPALRETVALSRWTEFLASARDASRLPEVSPGALAQIQYTSGTTGEPKGALLHHRGLTNNARLAFEVLGAQPGEVCLSAMPLFHTVGCGMGVLGTFRIRGSYVLLGAFEPGLMLALAEREHANLMLGVPTMLIAMLEHPEIATRDLSAVRVVASGGALIAPELVRAIEERTGARFAIQYGQTEASPVITMTSPCDDFEQRSTTLGRPLPHAEVKIADPASGATVTYGAVGELCVRGYMVMSGYHEMPEATATAIDSEGWLHTGDLASMDERGYCRIEGRLKDMIIRGGENIYPREIENLLFEHPAVGEVAVVGIPDENWGEQVAAFIRPAAGVAASEIDTGDLEAFLRARLAGYKCPRIWEIVEQFPLTASGKIRKHLLRDRYTDTHLGQATEVKPPLPATSQSDKTA